MNEQERLAVVKCVVLAGMWGHGGVAMCVIDQLETELPGVPRWSALYRDNQKDIKREYIGVIDDEEKLRRRLASGGWLTNYDEDGCSLFNAPPMNGLDQYVSKRLADKYPYGSQVPPESRLTAEELNAAYDRVFALKGI